MDVIKEAKVYILDHAFMSQAMQCRSNLFLCQPHFYSCCFLMRAIALYCLVWDSWEAKVFSWFTGPEFGHNFRRFDHTEEYGWRHWRGLPWCQWLVGKWKTCWKKKVKFQIWYQTPLMIITRLWWCCSLTNSWSRIGKCLLKAINLMVFYGVANVRQIDGSVAEMVQELNKQDPLIEDLDSKVDLFQA